MITCPRCQNAVDETKRASCPVCFAPVIVSGAPSGPVMPGYTPPPGSSAVPTVRPVNTSAPVAPPRSSPYTPPAPMYAPPPGSPYTPSPASYAPPPGSPYAAPAGSGAPVVSGPPPVPPMGTPPFPGYAPAGATRTTLTGEVVDASQPGAAYPPYFPHGGYTPPPASPPYSSGVPYAQRPAAQPNKGWSATNWKLAGGGTFTALYIAARLLLILSRNYHPDSAANSFSSTPPPSYSVTGRQPFGPDRSTVTMPYGYTQPTMPTMPQPRVYTPPNFPTRPNFPTGPHFPTGPTFPSHFQPPNMPTMPAPPRGFSGPNGMPGQGSFRMPSGVGSGNP
ncbi:MAG: hypothetical protein JWL77_6650 [Chthonomonadaceae bacterium]|nr:hypothetical protein [Chthonomonadaceae bacterium]